MSLYKTANLARDQHVLLFPHSANQFLAIFSKMQEFVQNSLFVPRSARLLILGNGRTTVFVIFGKVYEFVQNSYFSARSAGFVISALGAQLFSDFQQSPRVLQKSIFSTRSARYVISALGKPFFSKSERVCAKQRFEGEIITFSHLRHWDTTF